MSYISFMLVFLAIVTAIQMYIILMTRDSNATGLAMIQNATQDFQQALKYSAISGAFFFISFATEFLLLDSVSV